MQPSPTIRDVAKKAGVAISTVSLVINDQPNVSDEIRTKVLSVIKELHFHPRRSARGLASKRSGNIGFILTDDHFSVAEPFYTKIFLGTELEARKHNYYVLLTTVGRTVRETKELPRFLLEHNVDGVIIAGKISATWIEYIRSRNLPVLLIDYEVPRHRVSTVSMDNRTGVRLGVEHLLKLGHIRIGFLGGDLAHPSIAERYRSYVDTMTSAGISILPEWVCIDEPDTRSENGYNAARIILTHSHDRPTAVFAANDAMAIGCIQYCREAGIVVPESLAVVGFDNIEAGYHIEPRLTTVNVHREEMGSIAVRRLVEMIREKSDVVTKATTPVELIVRESCGMHAAAGSAEMPALLHKSSMP